MNIVNNSILTSLSGLENISPASIINLSIYNNPLLSECDVQSICDYLANPNGTMAIGNNASGCNSPEEVEEACLTSIEDNNTNALVIQPNPASDFITVSFPSIPGNVLLEIFSTSGEIVMNRWIETRLDIRTLPRGVYFVKVRDESGVKVAKLIKQ